MPAMMATRRTGDGMRIGGSYMGAVTVSAFFAVMLLTFGHIDPAMPRGAVQVPGLIVAFSPEIAIQARRAGVWLAAAGPEVLLPLKLAAALVVFLVVDFAAVLLFETTDDAWRGERVWEGPKPLWAALMFTALPSALYMTALLFQIAPIPRFGLSSAGFALAALAGGLAYGLGKPRREPVET